MLSEASLSTLIIAVVAMAILTALSRALPFLLPDDSKVIRFFTKENSPLTPLGGAIIIAMTMILALPFFVHLNENSPPPNNITAVAIGIISTIIATWRGINTGMSVIIGILGFLLGVWLF